MISYKSWFSGATWRQLKQAVNTTLAFQQQHYQSRWSCDCVRLTNVRRIFNLYQLCFLDRVQGYSYKHTYFSFFPVSKKFQSTATVWKHGRRLSSARQNNSKAMLAKQRKHAEQPCFSYLHINTENCASEYLHPGRGSPKVSAWKAKTLRKIVINKKHWCACVEALDSTDAWRMYLLIAGKCSTTFTSLSLNSALIKQRSRSM